MDSLKGEYILWAVILSIKVLLMSIITTIQSQFLHSVESNIGFCFPKIILILTTIYTFVNSEDYNHLTKANEPQYIIDPNIEHVRRAHLNEVENILTYLIIGGLYAITVEKNTFSSWILGIAAFSRIFHTFVYAFGLFPQSYRFLGFAVSYFINIFMLLQIVLALIFG